MGFRWIIRCFFILVLSSSSVHAWDEGVSKEKDAEASGDKPAKAVKEVKKEESLKDHREASRQTDPPPATEKDNAAVSPPAPTGATPEEMTPTAMKTKLGHKYQVGVEVGFGWGYRLIKPYGDIWCGQRDDGDNAAFCMAAAPPFVELGLSFGVTKSIDIITDFRYGLQKDDISDRYPLALMAGLRFWLNPDSAFKWALGLQVVMDFTKQDGDQQQRPDYKAPDSDSFDIGGRFYGQIQYDFFRYFGLYVKLSGVVGAMRWLRVEMEALGGVQARFP